MLKYIELKTGHNDDGPAWIGNVKSSKSGKTIYFNGRALKKGSSGAGNYTDLITGESFWVSGVKKNTQDRHWAGSGKVTIEASAVAEYLEVIGQSQLDLSRFVVSDEIEDTDPAEFTALENEPL